MTAQPLDPSAPRAALAPFGFLWAFAILYHQVGYQAVLSSPVDLALAGAALVALVHPGSPRALCLLGLCHVLVVLRALPDVTNHWYFGALVSMALVAASAGAASRGTGSGSAITVLDGFAPAGRASVVLVYGLSGFHKLNTDFFTPGVSCASVLAGRLVRFLGIEGLVPDPGWVVIWLTVAVELGLPIFLLVRRTRLPAILIAIGFHVAMALAGYPRFSATGVALLSLFLPADAFRLTSGGTVRVARGIPRFLLRFGGAGLLLGVALAGPRWSAPVFLVVQLLLAAALASAVIRTWRQRMPLPAVAGPRPVRYRQPALLVPIVLVAVAVQPYLGLATDRALAMYSNLRTEGGATNHLLVSARWQPFRFQRDMVTVVESSRGAIQALAASGVMVPFEELRARLTLELRRDRGDFSLAYRRRDTVRVVPSARTDPELGLPVPRLQWMFFRFRSVEQQGPRACTI